MLGGIETKELMEYRNPLEQFIASDDDGDPPAPLRDTDWLLDWIRNNESFSWDSASNSKQKLDAIVHGYLAATDG